ncbi:hypothetical protein PIB30_064986 [Stylosanthes scabra]|uniref:Uncharacterized protein n=1 Tax=Stylosanthes scabra TaxID=79078 RepID=A0ABU6QMR4_9FABA|nr:hypothetical protein [Stylosanthes scabra]
MDNENMKSTCGTQIPGRCHEVISQKEKNSHPPSCGTGNTMINLDSDNDNREITTPLSMMVASGIGPTTPMEPADDTGRASQPLETPTITRNLFHTLTSIGGRAKRPRTATVARSRPVLSAQNRKFRVTLAMDFSREDRKIFEYIFDESLAGWQELVKVAQTCATRDEMQDLRPGRIIPYKMVELVALTCMGAEKLNDPAATWWLPPSFAQRKLADVVEKLADYPFVYQEMNNMRDFMLSRPVGLRAGTCSAESSDVWVMDWMLIGSDFTGIIGEYTMADENKARACTAVYLVRSPFNRYRRIIARWAKETAEKKRTWT